MREIKFRAWIPDIKRMYQVNKIEVNPIDRNSVRDLLVWEHPCEKSAKIKGKVGRYRLTDEIPIMQFTGLTDKNGVEIYEGDVVVNGYGRICEITWHKFAARFDCEFIKDNSTNSGVDRSYGFRPQEWGFCIEVIGNVHQNPELLGDNNG